MKVKEILAKYPAGTLLAVWVRSFGGPSYLGVFIVAKRTLVYVGTFRKWGEIAKEIARNNQAVGHNRGQGSSRLGYGGD
jgi:hypothetical protein